jgi:hypothetical protein
MGKQISSLKCNKYDEPHEKHGLIGVCLFCRVSANQESKT